MTLRAAWIVNVDELEALNRSSIAAVKSWITARKDVYRAPYATMPETHQRHCVLIGSTNMATFLHDSTGSRRFWAMTIASDRKVDVDGLAADRDQLWAEAVHRYRAGEQWWLTDEESEQQAALNTRYEDEGWREDDITEFLLESGGRCTIHQVIEFLHARRPIGGDEVKAAGRIRAALQRAGWKLASGKARVGKPYPVRYWHDPRVAGSGGL
jgi:predicted P-loop ATPase